MVNAYPPTQARCCLDDSRGFHGLWALGGYVFHRPAFLLLVVSMARISYGLDVTSQMYLAPLTAVVSTALLCFLFFFHWVS